MRFLSVPQFVTRVQYKNNMRYKKTVNVISRPAPDMMQADC